jgi:hypothetical protein
MVLKNMTVSFLATIACLVPLLSIHVVSGRGSSIGNTYDLRGIIPDKDPTSVSFCAKLNPIYLTSDTFCPRVRNVFIAR